MKKVFIDTEVFMRNNFNFKHRSFRKLIEDVEVGLVSVYLTEVVKEEVISNICKKVHEDVKSSQKQFIKKARILNNLDEYKNIFNISDDIDNITKSLLIRFDEFLEDVDATIISINTVFPSEIFEKYFNETPPFSKRKKDEFPDAFSLMALQNFVETEKVNISIVSGNKDLNDFCKGSGELLYEESLESFFDSLTKDDDYNHGYVLSVFDNKYDDIVDSLQEHINDQGYVLNEEDGEVNEISVSYIEINDTRYIIDLIKEKQIAEITFNIEIHLTADITYIDYEASPYDQEKKEFLFYDYKNEVVDNILEVPVLITITYNNNDKNELDIIETIINENEDIGISSDTFYFDI